MLHIELAFLRPVEEEAAVMLYFFKSLYLLYLL